MHLVRSAVLGFCVAAFAALPARASVLHLLALLDGAQEVPQVGQAALGGTGLAHMFFDTDTNILSWTISYQLNTGPASAAHFHGPTTDFDAAGPGIASPVRVSIAGIAGTSSGTNVGSFDLDGLTNAANNPARLLGGQWYINIHTPRFPSGEIRGQVNVVPEPATMALLGLGLAALGCRRRRRP